MSALLQKIKSWVGKIKTKKTSYVRAGIYPSRHWQFLLLTTFATTFILAIVAIYFYKQIEQGKLFAVPEDNAVHQVNIHTKLLKIVVDDINAREENATELKLNKVKFSDPSI